MNARRKAKGINIDLGPQQTLNTKNLWLNVIITHSKLSIYMLIVNHELFQYFSHLSHSFKDVTQGNLPLK